MQCLECGKTLDNLDNAHLLDCCSLTLQEHAIRHHLPLDLLIGREQLNRDDPVAAYAPAQGVPSEQARAVFRGLKWGGLVKREGEIACRDLPDDLGRYFWRCLSTNTSAWA